MLQSTGFLLSAAQTLDLANYSEIHNSEPITYVIPLKNDHSIVIHTEKLLKKDDINSLTSYIEDKLKHGQMTIIFSKAMRNQFRIKSIELKCNDMFRPMLGFECLESYYSIISASSSDKRVVEDIGRGISAGACIPTEKKLKSFIYLVSMAEFVKRNTNLTNSEIKLMRNEILLMHRLLQKQIPENVKPLYEVASDCYVVCETDSNGIYEWRGRKDKVAFFVSCVKFREDCIGLNEVFSTDFAASLKSCLAPLASNLIEIGAGRGQLTAALREVKAKVLYVSDLLHQNSPWPGVEIKQKSAEKVTEYYKKEFQKVIYLSAQPCIEMITELIESGNKVIILQTGFTYPVQLEEYNSLQLKIIKLNIVGYGGVCTLGEVRLLAINLSSEEFSALETKVPYQYKNKV